MHTCKLIIKDEINCKLDGLPVEIRRKLATAFKYEIPAAKYQPSYKLGRWDGTISFFGIGGDGHLAHMPKILEILGNNNVEITEIIDKRRPVALTFPEVTQDFWGGICWPEGHQHAGKPIMIREDQVEALNLFIQNPQSIQELCTSFGKTIVTSTMAKLCEPFGRTIVIVPSTSLVEQTEEDFLNCQLDVGVYYGNRKDLHKKHTICTWQALSVLSKKSKNNTVNKDMLTLAEFLEGVSAVIVDEAHGLKANELRDLLISHLHHAPIRWALTGTIPKEEYYAQCLYTSIGPLVHTVKARELQDKGILSTCHIHIKQLMDVKQFKNYHDELKYLVTDVDRVKYIAGMIKEIAESGNTLVLVGRIETGKILQTELSSLFSLHGDKPDVAFVTGEIKSEDRKEEYDAFKTEDAKILIATSGVAAVGINIVSLYNLVLIEPGKSFVRVIQSIGRGLRKGFGKEHVDIWDITSTCKYSKRHLTERKSYYKDARYEFTVNKIDWDI